MYAWSTDSLSEPARLDYMRRAAMYSYDILRIRNREELWRRTAATIAEWVEASVVRGFRIEADGRPVWWRAPRPRNCPSGPGTWNRRWSHGPLPVSDR